MASIQLLHQFNGYTPGFHDFGAVENARLVALGLARSWTVEADGGQSFDDTLTSTEVAATRALVSGAGNIYYVPSPSGGDDAPVLRTYFAIPNAVLYLTDGEYLLGTRRGSSEGLKDILVPANGLTVIGRGRTKTRLKVMDTLPTNSAVIRATDPQNITLMGFELYGNKQRLGVGQAGVDENEGINWKGACTNVVMRDLWIHDTGQDCIDFDPVAGAAATLNLSSGTVIEDCLLENAGGLGIHNGCKGLRVRRTIVRNNCAERFALGVAPYGGFDPAEDDIVVDDSCEFSGNAFGQIVIDPTALGTVNGFKLRGLSKVTAASGTYGIFARANAINTEIIDATIVGASNQHAVSTETGCNDWVIGGASRLSSPATAHEVALIQGNGTVVEGSAKLSGGRRQLQVNGTGTRIRGAVWFEALGTSEYGYYCLTASAGGSIQGARFTGTPTQRSIILQSNAGTLVTGCEISYGVSGFTGNFVRGNRGVITEAYGNATILDGQSSVGVSHGLTNSGIAGITPASVILTKRSAEDIWRSGVSTSVFTVARAGTSGALTFEYAVQG